LVSNWNKLELRRTFVENGTNTDQKLASPREVRVLNSEVHLMLYSKKKESDMIPTQRDKALNNIIKTDRESKEDFAINLNL